MKFLGTVVLLFGALCMATAGCTERGSRQEESKGEGISIEFPGGSVKVGEGGVDVKAPGVDVQYDDKKGVGVKAPGVGVQVEPENAKVDAEAPGFKLKLDGNGSGGN